MLAEHAWSMGDDPDEYLISDEAWTLLDRVGRPVLCCGRVTDDYGVSLIWARVSVRSGPLMLPITRWARGWLGSIEGPRLVAHVISGFRAGCRWLEILGFECETPRPMRLFDGRNDAYQFARLQ